MARPLTVGFVRALARVVANAALPPAWIVFYDEHGVQPPELGRRIAKGVVLAPATDPLRTWPDAEAEAAYVRSREARAVSVGASEG